MTPDQREILKTAIRGNLKKTKTIRSEHSSYWLKHLFEKKLGFYISEDDLKDAMADEGFSSAPTRPNGPNCYFNVSTVSLKKYAGLPYVFLFK